MLSKGNPAYRVFISSTVQDLGDYRTAAAKAVLELEYQPVLSENFPAAGHSDPLQFCLDKVTGADLLIVILAKRYGWIPQDQPSGQKKSITWLECEQAERDGIEVLPFILDDSAQWPPQDDDAWDAFQAVQGGTSSADAINDVQLRIAKRAEFKQWLRVKLWKTFSSKEDLHGKVLHALYVWRDRQRKDESEPQGRSTPQQYSESHFSTGAALAHVAGETVAAIKKGEVRSFQALDEFSKLRAHICRGAMIGLRHFYKLGHPYPFTRWPEDPTVLAEYIAQYSKYMETARQNVGKRLASTLRKPHVVIALAEYSRAIFSGFELMLPNPDITFIVGIRPNAEVVGEFSEAVAKLGRLGCSSIRSLNYPQWISFLEQIAQGREKADYLLFGAEALLDNGDVVFPQILAGKELSALRLVQKSNKAQILCVAEAYKVLDPSTRAEAELIETEGRYNFIPSSIFHSFVTDVGEIRPGDEEVFPIGAAREQACEASRVILDSVTRNERLLPLSYFPNAKLRKVNSLVIDIDDTITISGKIEPSVLEKLAAIGSCGVVTILVTGRSAGWAQALCTYLPHVPIVIAENGLVMYDNTGESVAMAAGKLNGFDRRQLDQTALRLKSEFDLHETSDDAFRLFERTFVRPPQCGPELIASLRSVVSEGEELMFSSIHVHLRRSGWDKADGIRGALASPLFRSLMSEAPCVLVVGDSGNDRPLFRAFPDSSIGVANIRDMLDELGQDLPRYVTTEREGYGFIEIADQLVRSKAQFHTD